MLETTSFKEKRVNDLAAFLYLQLLDFLTTMVGIRVGLAESSPFICWMMNWNTGILWLGWRPLELWRW